MIVICYGAYEHMPNTNRLHHHNNVIGEQKCFNGYNLHIFSKKPSSYAISNILLLKSLCARFNTTARSFPLDICCIYSERTIRLIPLPLALPRHHGEG